MCRLLVFKGAEPIQLSELVTRPAHSIINQAYDSRLRLDATRAVNGDGFGVGWYDPDLPSPPSAPASAHSDEDLESASSASSDPAPRTPTATDLADASDRGGNDHDANPAAPCIFTSVTPAWNNANLHRLADKIRSPLVFAHVRASTAGALAETNCHPWRYGRVMWMHNGQVAQFSSHIKRRLLASLPDHLFAFPQGQTDSEHAFALFLSHLQRPDRHTPFAWRELRDALLATIADLNHWATEAGVKEPSLLNFVASDGCSVVASRYVSSATDEAASLYFSSGTSFYPASPGKYRMVKADKRERLVVITSEPLTFEKADWIQIPTNTCVVITPRMNVLQEPIRDQFASEPGAPERSPSFILRSGYQPNIPVGPAAERAKQDKDSSAVVPPASPVVPVPPAHSPSPPVLDACLADPAITDDDASTHSSHLTPVSAVARKPPPAVEAKKDALAALLRRPAKAPAPPAAPKNDENQNETREPIPLEAPSLKISPLAASELEGRVWAPPLKRILSPRGMERWCASPAFDEVLSFVWLLNKAAWGRTLRDPTVKDSPAVTAVRGLVRSVGALVQSTPPVETNSRFGNPAFRDLHAKLVAAVPALHQELRKAAPLPAGVEAELASYLTEAWGSAQRLDYGSGMELSFVLYLLGLVKVGYLDLARDGPALVLHVFWDYIEVMRRIQQTYWLEPAGSHGVWGLDDYHFLPFVWGSAQLAPHRHLRPRAIHDSALVQDLGDDYMYFSCVRQVNALKTASLRWHSPMLDDISAVRTWHKVNEGLRKMYRAEVLLKLPIAQHIRFGSIIPFPAPHSPDDEAEDALAAQEDDDGSGCAHGHGHTHTHTHTQGGDDGECAGHPAAGAATAAAAAHGAPAPDGQAAGWGDCCGIPIPAAFGAAHAAAQQGTLRDPAPGLGLGHGLSRGRGSGLGVRRIPFD